MEINKKTLAFTIEVAQDGKNWVFYIPAPSKNRVLAASPVLGYIFSMRQANIVSPQVIAKDYEVYAQEACDTLSKVSTDNDQDQKAKSAKMFTDFKNFIEESIMTGHVIGPDMNSMSILKAKDVCDVDTIEYAMGLYVFFYCIWRYAYQGIKDSVKKDIITSLSLTEYIASLQTLLSEKELSEQKAKA